MNSKHLVDPELLGLLDSFPPFDLSADTLPLIRQATFDLGPPGAPIDVEMTAKKIAGPDGAPDVGIVIYRPRRLARPLPCIFHIHGGGYVAGSAARLEAVHRALCDAAGCMIVSIDYRLAPETPAPGPLEDCYAGLKWLYAAAEGLGIDKQRIGVMGESAGGGLAAALALLARDRAEYSLAFQHLIYPMLDDRTCVTPDPHPYAGEFIWTPNNNRFGWASLLGVAPGAQDVSEYAAPARMQNLANLPRTFIATGALDLFVEEDIEYARRLMRSGVAVELHVYPGAYHGFDLAPHARVSKQAQRDSLDALRRAMAL
jgi:triacylglycerol lipase